MVGACARGPETAAVVLTAGEVETPDPTTGAFVTRLAEEICAHEQRCGRDAKLSQCRRVVNARAGRTLLDRSCEPAARRARIEECLATIRTEPCPVDLAHFPTPFCPVNDDCPTTAEALIPPGPALAKIWRP
jgi:hypothetical protein